MHAYEATRKREHFFGTAAGRDAWEARRDQLKRTAELHRASLKHDRSRDADDQHDITREYELAMRAFNVADQVVRHFAVIEPAQDATLVDIGVILRYQRYNEKGAEIGKPETVFVAEYGATDMRNNPPMVAYDNCMLLELLGCKVGDAKTIRLANGKLCEVEVMDIRLPAEYPPLRLVA